ncbi:hypothetical protein ABK040_007193 [Willaertia magna]
MSQRNIIYLLVLLSFVFLNVDCQSNIKCKIVEKGSFYQNGLPFYGFRSKTTISAFIQMTPIMSTYLFEPTDDMGVYCTDSWNKLYGSSRCGYLDFVHDDSDRFVWRRPMECVIQSPDHKYVLGNVNNCSLISKVEVAAYAYDLGQEPFKHQGTLLKIFKTLVDVGKWYEYELDFKQTETVYNLYSTVLINNELKRNYLLESITIQHQNHCNQFERGQYLDLYFGGRCPAPQQITCCYIYN